MSRHDNDNVVPATKSVCNPRRMRIPATLFTRDLFSFFPRRTRHCAWSPVSKSSCNDTYRQSDTRTPLDSNFREFFSTLDTIYTAVINIMWYKCHCRRYSYKSARRLDHDGIGIIRCCRARDLLQKIRSYIHDWSIMRTVAAILVVLSAHCAHLHAAGKARSFRKKKRQK